MQPDRRSPGQTANSPSKTNKVTYGGKILQETLAATSRTHLEVTPNSQQVSCIVGNTGRKPDKKRFKRFFNLFPQNYRRNFLTLKPAANGICSLGRLCPDPGSARSSGSQTCRRGSMNASLGTASQPRSRAAERSPGSEERAEPCSRLADVTE